MKQLTLEGLVENLLLAAGEPLAFSKLLQLCEDFPDFSSEKLEYCLQQLIQKYQHEAVEFKHLPSGYVIQTRLDYAPWIQKLWLEKPRKYSQAFLEVLAIIAYDQPITRSEIELKRGVAVAPNMIKSLLERQWIEVVGYKDAPGRPALYVTTTQFLDYFNLSSLDELPTTKVE